MIYFIQEERTNNIKIGWVKAKPQERMRTLQIGTPRKLSLLGCIHGSIVKEKLLQKSFKAYKIRGEWFKPGKDLLSFIKHFVREEKALNAGIIPFLLAKEEQFKLDLVMQETEKEIIQEALRKNKGRVKKAAFWLGISFRSLRYRLKRYGIDKDDFK